ncbi:MAG: A/G-specific adenine glycosylase [Burkholderiales bacterium]|nr:A/G-specific adenine glycosylase [Burkholderiales bacterium]
MAGCGGVTVTGRFPRVRVRLGLLEGKKRVELDRTAPEVPRSAALAASAAAGADASFAQRVIAWQRVHGRHDLPWQNTRDPYRIWLSEIMLQQTQVAAVVPYYQRFLARFPDLQALAAASEDAVLEAWAGLGYYARARNLHAAAKAVMAGGGGFPRSLEAVQALPGIGRSTAAAICAFAYGQRHAILDGNVKRVLARHFAIDGYPGERRVEQALWALSEALLPQTDIEAYTQGLMDLGAQLCVRHSPGCAACPLRDSCLALRQQRTGELPAARPAKVLPQRETHLLVLHADGELLLEKRPAPGIWGGLWCFPEIDAEQLPEQVMARFGIAVEHVQTLGVIEHGFTHFRLRIRPLLAQGVRPPRAEQPGRLWLTPADALGAAVPVPVRRILLTLHGDLLTAPGTRSG